MPEQATIWYQLVRENGNKLGSTACITQIPANIYLFCEVAKEKNSNQLSQVDTSQLTVYENKDAFISKNPMKSSASVAGLGGDEENALYVVVPEQSGAANQNPFHMLQIEENKLQILKLEEMNNKLEEKSAKLEEKGAKLEEKSAKLEEKSAKLEEKGAKLEEKSANLEETVNNYIRKAQTVAISDLDIEAIEKDGYVCEAKAVDTPAKIDFDIPDKFEWPVPDKENDKSNTDAYLEYLKKIALDFKKLQVKKTIETPHLNTTVGVNPHHLNGKADIYVMPSICRWISRNQLAMVFEMKPKEITSNNVAQAIGYVIAANSLFDIPGRPSPVGVLSDFIDQWVLIWIGTDSEICYAAREKDSDGNEKDLTRETAIYCIREHLNYYNQLLLDEGTLKRKADEFNWVFDGFEAGSLKKYRVSQAEDNMCDLLETDEEVALYNMRQRLRMTPLFDIPTAAEDNLSYFS